MEVIWVVALDEFVSQLPEGLHTQVGEEGTQLSGGQKQRIALACALLRRPALLLLDEATSSLDSSTERKLQQRLHEYLRKSDPPCTVIMVAHRLSTVRQCDQIYMLAPGQGVVEQGTHNVLMERRGRYANMVQQQSLEEDSDAGAAVQSRTLVAELNGPADSAVPGDSKHQQTLPEDPCGQDDWDSDPSLEVPKPKPRSPVVPLSRIWGLLAPDKRRLGWAVGLQILGAVVMPLWSLMFSQMVDVFYEPDPDAQRADANRWCLYFVAFGFLRLLLVVLSEGLFSLVGEALTMRVRLRTLTAMLSQVFSLPLLLALFSSSDHSVFNTIFTLYRRKAG